MSEITTDEVIRQSAENGDIVLRVQNDDGSVEERTVDMNKLVEQFTSIFDEQLKSSGSKYASIGKFYTDVIWTYRVKTAATDGFYIYFNPSFAIELFSLSGGEDKEPGTKLNELAKNRPTATDSKEKKDQWKKDVVFYAHRYLIFVLIHECYHKIYRHLERGIKHDKSIATNQNKFSIMNIAGDEEINRDIETQFPEFAGCTEKSGGCYTKEGNGSKYGLRVCEDIYDILLPDMNNILNKMPPQSINNDIQQSQDSSQGQGQGQGQDQQQNQQNKNGNSQNQQNQNGQQNQSGQQNQQNQQNQNGNSQNQNSQQNQQNQNGNSQNQNGQRNQQNQAGQQNQQNQAGQQNGNSQNQAGQQNQKGNQNNGGDPGGTENGGDPGGTESGGVPGGTENGGEPGGTQIVDGPIKNGKGNGQQTINGPIGPFGPDKDGESSDSQNGKDGDPSDKPSGKEAGKEMVIGRDDALDSNIDSLKSQKKFDVKCGSSLSGDMITKEEGMKIFKEEKKQYGKDALRKDPIEDARRVFDANKDALISISGKDSPLAKRIREISEILKVEPVINWKKLLRNCLKEAGLDPKTYKTIKKPRISSAWRGDRLVNAKEKSRIEPKYDFADIFYLIDASGSISKEVLARVFVEIFNLEKLKDIKIQNSALSYFSTDIIESRIRTWKKKDSDSIKKSKIIYNASEDPSGGTDIVKSVEHVRALREYYRDKHTLMILMTDAEDNIYQLASLPKKVLTEKFFVIVLNTKDRLEGKVKELVSYGVKPQHIIPIDTNEV